MRKENREEKKQLVRLLKLLQRFRVAGAEWHRDDLMVTVIAGGRSWRFRRSVMDQAQGQGLIGCANGKAHVSDVGEAFLKRALHPETPFVAQHSMPVSDTVRCGGEHVQVIRNANESPLLRLHTRKMPDGETWLSDAHFQAGEKLRADFERARLQPRISANWEASVASSGRGSGAAEISDFALDARARVERAIAALGPELSGVALDVCCFLKGLEQVESEQRWPPRSAKLILRTALSVLARHYGLAMPPDNRVAGQKLRQWGARDYRPRLGQSGAAGV